MPDAPFELAPKNVLLFPMVFRFPATTPKKELDWPVVFEEPACRPKKELEKPEVLEKPAENPKNEFVFPVVLKRPALPPKKEFLSPVVLLLPEVKPANRLNLAKSAPKTLLPPILYWAVVFMEPVLVSPPPTVNLSFGFVTSIPMLPALSVITESPMMPMPP